jgi:hypothetical protein
MLQKALKGRLNTNVTILASVTDILRQLKIIFLGNGPIKKRLTPQHHTDKIF